MKAITHQTYGDAGVLSLNDVDAPTPGKGQVLVEVRAAGCGPEVVHLVSGTPYLVRLAIGITKPRNPVPGRDVAGIVAAVGPEVTGFAVGDEVLGTGLTGTFSEYVVCRADRLAHKPSAVSWVDAAALPVSAGTAVGGLDAGRVTEGSRVLVIGASGGVGAYLVQLAAARGAIVTGVCSAANAELVRSLGATDVLDYAVDEVDRDGAVYDAVLDCAGNRPLSLLRRTLAPGGTLVIVGGDQAKGKVLAGFQRGLLSPAYGLIARRRMLGLISKEQGTVYADLAAQVEAGTLKPVIDSTWTLAAAPDAVRRAATGRPKGKVVVTV